MEKQAVEQKNRADLTSGPVLRGIILFAVPLMCTSVLQLLFNAADMIVVGRFRGSFALAAVGATGAITNLIINFFIGLSLGSGVSAAHAIGARDEKMAFEVVHTAIPTAFVSGLILTGIGLALAETLLGWMGTPETVLPHSAVYMKIYFCGMPVNMIYNFCASILRAAGDTRKPLIYLSVAGVVNVLFNILFVAVFGMGVDGVALATVISQMISAVLIVAAMTRRTDMIRLDIRKLRIYRRPLLKIIRLGIPAGLNGSLFSISNVLIQSSVNSLGDVVMAGNAAGSNLEGFVYVIQNSFAQAAMNYTGQALGAGKTDRIRKIFLAALGSVIVFGMFFGGSVYLLGRPLLGIYITDSPESISYGIIRLGMVCLPYFLCGMMDVSTMTLRGMGRSFLPMIVSVAGVCGLRILWIFTVFRMPAYHDLHWLLVSYPISWTVTFLVQTLLLMFAIRKLQKQRSSGRTAV